MDQKAYLELSAMLNSFPSGSADPDVLHSTFERALTGLPSEAVAWAAQRYSSGEVEGQSTKFAPTVAEFTQETKRRATLLPFRNQPSLPAPKRDGYREPPRSEKVRMGFKLSLLSASWGNGGIDRLAEANKGGLEQLIALGLAWGVPVPDELYDQVGASRKSA